MNEYKPWLFSRDDRVIRPLTHKRRARYCARVGRPDDFLTLRRSIDEYLYLTDAKTLRQRLEAAGYYQTKLDLEYLRCWQQTKFAFSRPDRKRSYSAPEYQQAFHHANLDDWLIVLKEVVSKGLTQFSKSTDNSTSSDRHPDMNLLVDMVTDLDAMDFEGPRRDHTMGAFPCTTRECMALAMLQVVPDDTECTLDVSELVTTGLTGSFDDLTAEKKHAAPPAR